MSENNKRKNIWDEYENKALMVLTTILVTFMVLIGTVGYFTNSDNIEYKRVEMQTSDGSTVYLMYENGELKGIDTDGDNKV